MAFIAIGVVTATATAVGAYNSYRGAKQQESQYKAQASYEKASTDARVAEEQTRTQMNLLRAQEEKRKELSKQRAAFVQSGVLPNSPSADLVIGELGMNLQTRIQDMFLMQSSRISNIQETGNSKVFNALNNASAASTQATGAIFSGISSIGQQALQAGQMGLFSGGGGGGGGTP